MPPFLINFYVSLIEVLCICSPQEICVGKRLSEPCSCTTSPFSEPLAFLMPSMEISQVRQLVSAFFLLLFFVFYSTCVEQIFYFYFRFSIFLSFWLYAENTYYVLAGTKMQEIVVSRGKILELLRPDANTGKVHTLLTMEVFGIIRSLMAFRLTGGTKG